MRAVLKPLTATSRAIAAQSAISRQAPQLVSRAAFSTSRGLRGRNQLFDPVRNADQFYNYQLLSSSARTPLITLWTTSWCPTCRVVKPLLQDLVAAGTGEEEGGVAFCEVIYDAPDIMSANFGLTYMITSVPTLLSFDAQEAQTKTKVVDGRQLADRKFLEEWLCEEARRHGGRGGGGGGGGSIFNGLFGR